MSLAKLGFCQTCTAWWPRATDAFSSSSYLGGLDAARGRPLGVVRFGPDTLHDMRSVTKSIVGLLYGIALANGCVPTPEAKLVEQFMEYPDLALIRQGSVSRSGMR